MNKNKKKNLIIITLIILIIPVYFIYDMIMTSKIKSDRDSMRLLSISSIRTGVELYNIHNSEYPKNLSDIEGKYIPKIPIDPLDGQTINGCEFGYEYLVRNSIGADNKVVNNGTYTISTCFESKENIDTKAAKDGGKDPLRYEINPIGL